MSGGFIMIGVIVWGVEIRLSKESKILIHWGYSLVLVLAGHNLMAAGAGVLAYIAGLTSASFLFRLLSHPFL